MASIIVIDDNETMREGMETIISRMGHKVHGASSGADGLKLLKRMGGELVLTDLKMEGMDGLEVVARCRAMSPDVRVLLITAYGTIESAVEAMRKGAFDFIQKPFSQDLLRLKVKQALEYTELSKANELLEQKNRYLCDEAGYEFSIDHIIGGSDALKGIMVTMEKVAIGDSTVYIQGESGTGKELIARAIHLLSPRKDKSFIKVNCSALAEGVMESELFGHERGSFTGAIKRKIGRFELADGGALFLDEIGDISPSIQLKLLRVLQEREFERVGGQITLTVDVRIICATNKNLLEEVAKGTFREDLYYRLHIVPITIPPLRERMEDIPALVDHFIKKLGKRTRKQIDGIDEAALQTLSRYPWPGNIRELENVIEQTMVLCEGKTIRESDLPHFLSGGEGARAQQGELGKKPLTEILEEMERRMIKEAYEKTGRVKTETAKLLGIKTSALYYKLEKYGLIENG